MRTILSSVAMGLVAGVIGTIVTLQVLDPDDDAALDVPLHQRVAALEARLLELTEETSVAPRRDGPTRHELESIRDRIDALEASRRDDGRAEADTTESRPATSDETESVTRLVRELVRSDRLDRQREQARKWKESAARKSGDRARKRASHIAGKVALDDGQTRDLAIALQTLETTNIDHYVTIKDDTAEAQEQLAALEGIRRNIDQFSAEVRSFMTIEQVERLQNLDEEWGKSGSPLEVPAWLEEMEQELRERR